MDSRIDDGSVFVVREILELRTSRVVEQSTVLEIIEEVTRLEITTTSEIVVAAVVFC